MQSLIKLCLLVLFALICAPMATAERIKDMAQIQGVRTNQLVGYGLVVGLDGSGDQTSQAPFTIQSLNNMLAQLGVVVPPGVTPQLKNVAAVAVHAVLPAFVKPGQTIDITVNSIANAKVFAAARCWSRRCTDSTDRFTRSRREISSSAASAWKAPTDPSSR